MTATSVRAEAIHRSAQIETAVERAVAGLLARIGWRPQVVPYPGYGAARGAGTGPDGWVRVFARVLMLPPRYQPGDEEGGRGWRRFVTVAVPETTVDVLLGAHLHQVTSGPGGYVDAVLPSRLPGGRHDCVLAVAGSYPAGTVLHVVGADQTLGLISDIDDTVVITALPRPLLAAWNTFVRQETVRRPVPGMAELYRRIVGEDPDALVAYVSTGAWNVAPSLVRFLTRHGFPPGPLLLTDWGPTPEGWWRSGKEHKRVSLRRLLHDLPRLRWILVGDDGQHDPALYAELVDETPESVRFVAIRELSVTEQVLTHGTPQPLSPAEPSPSTRRRPGAARVPWLRAPDGDGLARLLQRLATRPARRRAAT